MTTALTPRRVRPHVYEVDTPSGLYRVHQDPELKGFSWFGTRPAGTEPFVCCRTRRETLEAIDGDLWRIWAAL